MKFIFVTCYQREEGVWINPVYISSIIVRPTEGYFAVLRTVDACEFFISEDEYTQILRSTWDSKESE